MSTYKRPVQQPKVFGTSRPHAGVLRFSDTAAPAHTAISLESRLAAGEAREAPKSGHHGRDPAEPRWGFLRAAMFTVAVADAAAGLAVAFSQRDLPLQVGELRSRALHLVRCMGGSRPPSTTLK